MLSKHRDRAWNKAESTNNEADWENARRLRNWANNTITAAKTASIQHKLNNNVNAKRFWFDIKEVLPDQSGGLIDIQNQLTQEIMPKNLQAQEINNFLANVGEKQQI